MDFELIFVQGARYRSTFILLLVDNQSLLHHLLKMLVFSTVWYYCIPAICFAIWDGNPSSIVHFAHKCYQGCFFDSRWILWNFNWGEAEENTERERLPKIILGIAVAIGCLINIKLSLCCWRHHMLWTQDLEESSWIRPKCLLPFIVPEECNLPRKETTTVLPSYTV